MKPSEWIRDLAGSGALHNTNTINEAERVADHAEALEAVAESAETHAEMQTPETLMFLTDTLDRLRELEDEPY